VNAGQTELGATTMALDTQPTRPSCIQFFPMGQKHLEKFRALGGFALIKLIFR
jgi:hypothetical protein